VAVARKKNFYHGLLQEKLHGHNVINARNMVDLISRMIYYEMEGSAIYSIYFVAWITSRG
jgi:hypothetical protein